MEEATDKQINFATKLGIQLPEQFSKSALRELINAKIGDNEKGNGHAAPHTAGYGAPVEKPYDPVKETAKFMKATKEYHLSPEQEAHNKALIKKEALVCAISLIGSPGKDLVIHGQPILSLGLMEVAKVFEEWINGSG